MTAASHTSRRNPSTGRRAWWMLADTLRFVGRVLRGLIAAAALLALVAGLPWALWHYIGWPLPDHVPTWAEVQVVLLAPMSPQFLLDVLACLLWLLWARFTFDVLAAIPDAIRPAPWPHRAVRSCRRPLHAAAGVLVSAILLSVVSSRSSSPATSAPTAARFVVGEPTTIASALHSCVAHSAVDNAEIVTAALHTRAGRPSATTETETVRPPEHGVYDSLWRIAERRLGDGDRWPEIWTLNKGAKQVDGREFTNPNLIHPNWVLRLPAAAENTLEPPPVDASPAPPNPSPPERPWHDPGAAQEVPPTQAPTLEEPAPADAAQHAEKGGSTISTSTGAFVGLGLAALIAVALITVRLNRRRRYRPGLKEPDDPTRAPIVRALRIAHDSLVLAQFNDGTPTGPGDRRVNRLPELDTRDRAQDTARAVLANLDEIALGVHDGQGVALSLARSKGVGLIGPGALAAARALVVTLLARAVAEARDTVAIVPAADAHTLFGTDLPTQVPARLRIVDDLTTALDAAEAELLRRARQLEDAELDISSNHNVVRAAPLVLVASPTPDAERRIQAILDNGSTFGLVGILLGQWRPGGTVRVRDDGTVGATSPDLAENLTGTRLFTLPGTDATDLLALLHDADSGYERSNVATEPAGVQDPGPDHTALAAPAPEQVPSATIAATYDFAVAEAVQSQRAIAPTPLPPGHTVVIDIPARSSAARDQQRDLGQSASRPVAPPQAARPQKPDDQKDITEPRLAEPIDTPTGQTSAAPEASTTVRASRESEHPALRLAVLGRLNLWRTEPEHADIIDVFAPRQREILTYLALHPNGVRKQTLTASIWPEAHPDRPYNTFHATLSQLRGALRKATENVIVNIVRNDDGHYRLDRSLVAVDLWQLQDELMARRQAPTVTERVAALRQVAELYRGDLAEGVAADWIDAPREALRRDVLDALSALIRAVADGDPEQMLALLEQARGLDPYNEAIYRDLMRVQARLGQYDSIPRTLRLLITSLAELDQQPTRDTLGLAELLRRPRSAQRHDREAS